MLPAPYASAYRGSGVTRNGIGFNHSWTLPSVSVDTQLLLTPDGVLGSAMREEVRLDHP